MRKMGRYLDKGIAYCGYVGMGMAVASVIIMTIMITLHVVLRYVFHVQLKFTDEFGGYLFVVITFMALAYVMRQEAHVSVELVFRHYPLAVRNGLEVLKGLAALLLMSLYLKYGWGIFMLSVQKNMKAATVLATPLWIPQTFLWLGVGVLILELIARTVKSSLAFHKSLRKKPDEGIPARPGE